MENSETLQIVPTLVPFVMVIFIIAIGVVLLNYQFRKNLFKKQLEQEELKQAHQQKLLETSILIQEKERKRIAQDLHDELGATLSMSRMQLSNFEKGEIFDQEKLLGIRNLIESALESTRRISRELMPIQLEQLGLKRALLSLVHFAQESTEIAIKTTIHIEQVELTPSSQLGVYRIFSELLNNTIKHAGASEVELHLSIKKENITAEYQDNGSGINFDRFQSGLGVQSIENRVDYLNGSWEYGNRQTGGFYAKFLLPLKSTITEKS